VTGFRFYGEVLRGLSRRGVSAAAKKVVRNLQRQGVSSEKGFVRPMLFKKIRGESEVLPGGDTLSG